MRSGRSLKFSSCGYSCTRFTALSMQRARAHHGGAVRLFPGLGGAGLFLPVERDFMDPDAHFRPRPGAGAGGDFPAGAACGAGEAGQPSVLLLLRQASAG